LLGWLLVGRLAAQEGALYETGTWSRTAAGSPRAPPRRPRYWRPY